MNNRPTHWLARTALKAPDCVASILPDAPAHLSPWPMRNFVLPALLVLLTAAAPPELSRWRSEASSVTIARDDWGIAHVHGKSDADAVFGMIYAQAEDDFPRVE